MMVNYLLFAGGRDLFYSDYDGDRMVVEETFGAGTAWLKRVVQYTGSCWTRLLF